MSSAYRFLGMLPTEYVTDDTAGIGLSVDDVKDLGRIRVKVCRIYRFKRAVPLYSTRQAQEPVTEVSEKILKGKATGNIARDGALRVYSIGADGPLPRAQNKVPSTEPRPTL